MGSTSGWFASSADGSPALPTAADSAGGTGVRVVRSGGRSCSDRATFVAFDRAVPHRDDPRHARREVAAVGHDQERCAAHLVQIEEESVDRVARLAVEVAGGFVGEDELGVHDESSGEGDPLLLAARELAGSMREPVAKAHFF